MKKEIRKVDETGRHGFWRLVNPLYHLEERSNICSRNR